MSNNLNKRYSYVVTLLYAISKIVCDDRSIELVIDIPSEDALNACVFDDGNNIFHIMINSGCLNLGYAIEQITQRYDENDLKLFGMFRDLSVFDKLPDDTFREELNNLFNTIILIHIFFHEFGHVIAGHVGKTVQPYEEYDANRQGSYLVQEREMVADWLSIKNLVRWIYRKLIKDDEHSRSSEEIIHILKRIIVLIWISLSIEFQMFDSRHQNNTLDYSKRTHPHPSVRLYYNLEAMIEAISDMLVDYGLDIETADVGALILADDEDMIIRSFIQISDIPLYNELSKEKTIDYYIELRDAPDKNNARDNGEFHLAPLSDQYREMVDKHRAYLG